MKTLCWRLQIGTCNRRRWFCLIDFHQQWLAGTSYQVDTVNANDGVVEITVEGTGPLKPAQQLANQLAIALGHPVVVELRVLPVLKVKSSDP